MTDSTRRLLDRALALPERDRLEIVSEPIASVDGPADEDWESAWLAELDCMEPAALLRGQAAPEWSEVRARSSVTWVMREEKPDTRHGMMR